MKTKSAFTLIELMVVIAIIGVLGVVITPVIRNGIVKANAAKIVAVASTLATACELFNDDTGEFAIEIIGTGYVGTNQLSSDPGIFGWDGPYIKSPLTNSSNPYRAPVWVLNDRSDAWTTQGGLGFDLDLDGTAEVTGDGNFVVFFNVPDDCARRVSEAMDGDEGGWDPNGKARGKVEHYTGGALANALVIFLL